MNQIMLDHSLFVFLQGRDDNFPPGEFRGHGGGGLRAINAKECTYLICYYEL